MASLLGLLFISLSASYGIASETPATKAQRKLAEEKQALSSHLAELDQQFEIERLANEASRQSVRSRLAGCTSTECTEFYLEELRLLRTQFQEKQTAHQRARGFRMEDAIFKAQQIVLFALVPSIYEELRIQGLTPSPTEPTMNPNCGGFFTTACIGKRYVFADHGRVYSSTTLFGYRAVMNEADVARFSEIWASLELTVASQDALVRAIFNGTAHPAFLYQPGVFQPAEGRFASMGELTGVVTSVEVY